MSGDPEVEPGQVWADNDPRCQGRTLRVDQVFAEAGHAVCTILTEPTAKQERIDAGDAWVHDRRGKQTRVALRRLKPTSTGYRLVTEAPAPREDPAR